MPQKRDDEIEEPEPEPEGPQPGDIIGGGPPNPNTGLYLAPDGTKSNRQIQYEFGWQLVGNVIGGTPNARARIPNTSSPKA